LQDDMQALFHDGMLTRLHVSLHDGWQSIGLACRHAVMMARQITIKPSRKPSCRLSCMMSCRMTGQPACMPAIMQDSLQAGWLALIFAENLPLPWQRGGVCIPFLCYSPACPTFAHSIANVA